MSKIAVIMFDEEIKKLNLHGFIVNCVHDEIVAECPENEAEQIKNLLQECMEKAGRMFCKTIPIIAEPSIGTDWGAK